MALTVAWKGYGRVTDAEDKTNWTTTGGISAEQDETDIYIQNTQAVSSKASNKAGALIYDIGAGSELDFDVAGSEEGQHVFIWLNCTTVGIVDTVDNGGLRIWLGTDLSNYAEWYILGSDTLERYSGGWIRLCLDPTKTPTEETGTSDVGSVRYFGIYISTTGSSKSENLIVDAIDVGFGLRAHGTSNSVWQDIVNADMGTQNNKYGVLQDRDGIFFALGELELGDNQAPIEPTVLSDQDRVVRWASQEYYDEYGIWNPMISNDFQKFTVVGNATGYATLQDGIAVGSDQGRNGSIFIGSDLHKTTVDLYDGSNANNFVKLYGTQFKLMSGGISWGDDSDYLYFGGSISQCGQFDPVGAVQLRNLSFYGAREFHILNCAIQDDGGDATLTDYTPYAWNRDPALLSYILPVTEVSGDRFILGASEVWDSAYFKFDTVSTGSHTITWEYYNGSTWTQISPSLPTNFTDGTSGFTQDGFITFEPPSDWASTTIGEHGNRTGYLIRARLTGATGTQPITEYILISAAKQTASALKWNANIDVEDCSFIAMTDVAEDPRGIEHAVAGEYDYTDLQFSGNDYDIEVSYDATQEDIYADSNYDDYYTLGHTITAVAQSFKDTSGQILSQIKIYMNDFGSPTGNMVAKLYAHSGTYGTSSVPTGTALATSENVDAGDISLVLRWITFDFLDGYQLAGSNTEYCLVIEFSGGDASNYIKPGTDSSSPTHGGNAAYYDTGWNADNTEDMIFEVMVSDALIINNIGLSDASSYVITGDATYVSIVTAVNLTITVKDEDGVPIENAQTAIYTNDSNRTELMNEDTNVSGIATEVYASTLPQSVEVRVRRTSPGGYRYIPFSQIATITTDGLTLEVRLRIDPNAVPAEEEVLLGGERVTIGGERVIMRK